MKLTDKKVIQALEAGKALRREYVEDDKSLHSKKVNCVDKKMVVMHFIHYENGGTIHDLHNVFTTDDFCSGDWEVIE